MFESKTPVKELMGKVTKTGSGILIKDLLRVSLRVRLKLVCVEERTKNKGNKVNIARSKQLLRC